MIGWQFIAYAMLRLRYAVRRFLLLPLEIYHNLRYAIVMARLRCAVSLQSRDGLSFPPTHESTPTTFRQFRQGGATCQESVGSPKRIRHGQYHIILIRCCLFRVVSAVALRAHTLGLTFQWLSPSIT